MASLHIKNFGPIKDSTKIELSSLMAFIGRQSAGKSTFLKVLCFCRWAEKSIMLSANKHDIEPFNDFSYNFENWLKEFFRLNNEYFSVDTQIQYKGDCINIDFSGKTFSAKVTPKENFLENRYNTKLCYIPSERNLVSAVQDVGKRYKTQSFDFLANFIDDWMEAKSHYTYYPLRLSATGDFSYINKSGLDFLVRKDGSETPAFFASSGMQSLMPLEVMTNYITNRVGQNAYLSQEERSKINNQGDLNSQRRQQYQSAQLFIEEPEQNLYPESQKLVILNLFKMLKKALENGLEQSMAVVTTHSPYVISVINVLLKAAVVQENNLQQTTINKDYILPSKAISAYYINQEGVFENILDKEIPMLSGNNLDGVSDWVEDSISELNQVLFS